jgi:hypothetical protein
MALAIGLGVALVVTLLSMRFLEPRIRKLVGAAPSKD